MMSPLSRWNKLRTFSNLDYLQNPQDIGRAAGTPSQFLLTVFTNCSNKRKGSCTSILIHGVSGRMRDRNALNVNRERFPTYASCQGHSSMKFTYHSTYDHNHSQSWAIVQHNITWLDSLGNRTIDGASIQLQNDMYMPGEGNLQWTVSYRVQQHWQSIWCFISLTVTARLHCRREQMKFQ